MRIRGEGAAPTDSVLLWEARPGPKPWYSVSSVTNRQQQASSSSRLGQPSGRFLGGSGQRLISLALRWK